MYPLQRGDDLVALHLCVELHRGPEASSRWAHIDVLPKSFDTPFYWDEDELRELEGTTVLVETLRLKEETAEDFEAIEAALEAAGESKWLSAHGVTRETYFWARSNQWSRQCDLLQPDGRDAQPALIGRQGYTTIH